MHYMYRMDQPQPQPEIDRFAQFERICDYRAIRAARTIFRSERAAEIIAEPMDVLMTDLQNEAALLRLDEQLEQEVPDLIEVRTVAEDGSMQYRLVQRNSLNNDDATDSVWLRREKQKSLVSGGESSLTKALPGVSALPPATRSRVEDGLLLNKPPEPARKEQTVVAPAAPEPKPTPSPIVPANEEPAQTTRPEKKTRFSRFSKAMAAGVVAVGALVGSMFVNNAPEPSQVQPKVAVEVQSAEDIATTQALLSEDFANMVSWTNENPNVDFADAMSGFYE
jgi:hypothetical protein